MKKKRFAKIMSLALTLALVALTPQTSHAAVRDNVNLGKVSNDLIIDAVNSRGGSLSSEASQTDIANAIKELNLHTLGTVSYEFHFCDNTCWRGCTGTMYLISDGDSPGGYQYDYQCRSCGARRTTYSPGNTIPCLNNAKICGHNSGDIVSATIVY